MYCMYNMFSSREIIFSLFFTRQIPDLRFCNFAYLSIHPSIFSSLFHICYRILKLKYVFWIILQQFVCLSWSALMSSFLFSYLLFSSHISSSLFLSFVFSSHLSYPLFSSPLLSSRLLSSVLGVYMHSQKGEKRDKSGFPVFSTVIEANCVQKKNGSTNNDLSDEDKRKIKELSNDPQVCLKSVLMLNWLVMK